MTLAPSTLARSAAELNDDDGQPVATIYARASGIEIVCQQGWTAEYSHDRESLIEHLGVTFSHDGQPRAGGPRGRRAARAPEPGL